MYCQVLGKQGNTQEEGDGPKRSETGDLRQDQGKQKRALFKAEYKTQKQTKRGRKNKVATEQQNNKLQRKKGKVQIKNAVGDTALIKRSLITGD